MLLAQGTVSQTIQSNGKMSVRQIYLSQYAMMPMNGYFFSVLIQKLCFSRVKILLIHFFLKQLQFYKQLQFLLLQAVILVTSLKCIIICFLFLNGLHVLSFCASQRISIFSNSILCHFMASETIFKKKKQVFFFK